MRHIHPEPEAIKRMIMAHGDAPITMLNLLRFRDVADYSEAPELAPSEPISGKAAYDLYVEHALPHVHAAGAEVLFKGKAGAMVIGPPEEIWDLVLLVRHQSAQAFIGFASNVAYLAGLGHRTAALADSRLLPIAT